jgi:hypothetical protein
MSDFLDALEAQLVGAAERRLDSPAESMSRPTVGREHQGQRKRRRGTLVLIPALIILAVGGLALGGVIEIGAPAKTEISASGAGYGPLTPGSSHLLAISTPDPHGGPPWGMRVFSTKRGVGCIQIGRLLDGRLGAIGQDGAFNDDGRFHEVKAGDAIRFFSCSALDADGRIFNNVTVGDEPASAWTGTGAPPTRYRAATPGTCVPATATPAEKAPQGGVPVKICSQADERDLYYGLLGPDAKSITYTSGGQQHTIATVGPEGAYLIATVASTHQLFDFSAGGTSDVVPVDGPITAIHYRNGSTCHLTSRSWIGGTSACSPSLQVPVGYLPVKTPTRSQVASGVHSRVLRNSRGETEIAVSFVSRIPLTEYRSAYSLKLDEPDLHGRATAQYRAENGADIAAGQTVTMTIRSRKVRGSLSAGVYGGTITLISATGPALFEGPGTVYIPVGRFSIRVP